MQDELHTSHPTPGQTLLPCWVLPPLCLRVGPVSSILPVTRGVSRAEGVLGYWELVDYFLTLLWLDILCPRDSRSEVRFGAF